MSEKLKINPWVNFVTGLKSREYVKNRLHNKLEKDDDVPLGIIVILINNLNQITKENYNVIKEIDKELYEEISCFGDMIYYDESKFCLIINGIYKGDLKIIVDLVEKTVEKIITSLDLKGNSIIIKSALINPEDSIDNISNLLDDMV